MAYLAWIVLFHFLEKAARLLHPTFQTVNAECTSAIPACRASILGDPPRTRKGALAGTPFLLRI